MADEKPIDPHVRKTLSLTHKQAGLTAGGIAAMTAVLVGPLSQFFQTKLDAAKQGTSIAVQANQIAELKSQMDASKNEIISAIRTSVASVAKDVERHETRIVNLEFIEMQKGAKK